VKRRLGVPMEYHRWIEFRDANGRGYCEPELFLPLRDVVVLFEMKLSGGPMAKLQLEGLYKPLLEHIYQKPVRCLLVCKWVRADTPLPIFATPEKFLLSGKDFGTWQFLEI